MLGNGAGKMFVSKMLDLLDLPVPMNMRVSTTSNPKYDWCGIDFPKITGVVDFAVVHNGVWRMGREIHLKASSKYSQPCRLVLRTQDIGHMVRSMLLFDFAIHNMHILCRDHG